MLVTNNKALQPGMNLPVANNFNFSAVGFGIRSIRLVALITGIFFNQYAQSELILSAPPRETHQEGVELYGPLADHLSTLLGEKVTYKSPSNWLEYQRDLRHGIYDIVFDGPHFVAWRVEHLKHDVLVKLPGTLQFVVAVYQNDQEINGLDDIVGRKICAIPPPNLSTLIIMEQFPNPVRQPVLWDVQGGFKEVYEALRRHECRAGVFRSDFYEKQLEAEDRAELKVIFRSKALPNQAISVSPRLKADKKNNIIRSLTVGEGRDVAISISRRFASQEGFVAATKEEYSENTTLLEDVIFAW